ncbi:hypothetical protein KBZ94_03320 [Streptomyces sp. RM72]|uniref:hypothetical protein n=1 Tax=unclassified Streptomyces TaxID=2593676 RepID=UPI000EF6180C|nr:MULTISPECIES: hypothetical protein [unclassified Streptomyces]MBQ0883966.1 hypothetical protein [Streptomyces sp. RM72]
MSDIRLRVTAGVTAGVLALALAVLVAVSRPELIEWARAKAEERDRTGEAFLFAWALIVLPVAGLLQTPVARGRGARIGAGWALLAGYWLLVLLLVPVAWQTEGLFPATDGPGKSGGVFGAAIGLVIGTPVYAVVSGAVFRTVRPEETLCEQIRGHVTGVVVLTSVLAGAVVGLACGLGFRFPAAGAPALALPGGILWGLHAGAALGYSAAARLQPSRAARRTATATALAFARTGAALLVCCLCVSQLGWVLPGWAVAVVGIPAPFLLFVCAARWEWLGRWVSLRTVEVPKGAFA